MLSAPPRARKSMLSTSSRSIVTLATSRRKRTRPPLATMSMFSLAFEPKKSIVSVPSWPSMVSLPSPGSHWKTSSPAPMQGHVVAVVAEDEVVAVAAEEHVGALRAEERVVAGAAVDRQLDDAGGQRGRRHAVVAAQGVDDERIVGPFGVGDVHLGRQPDHGDRSSRAEDVDDVVAVGAVDDDGVGLGVAGRAADRAGQVDVDLDEVGAAQVVDGGRVGAAQGVQVDGLDVVEVHDDVAEVAGEPHAPAVGRGLEDLVAALSR